MTVPLLPEERARLLGRVALHVLRLDLAVLVVEIARHHDLAVGAVGAVEVQHEPIVDLAPRVAEALTDPRGHRADRVTLAQDERSP